MKKVLKSIINILVIIILCNATIINTYAEGTYKNYTYNIRGDVVPAPESYVPVSVFTGENLGVGDLNKPVDMCFDSNKNLYILDSGNNRIIIFDKNMNYLRSIKSIIDENNNEINITKAEGITLSTNGTIYICDKGNERIVLISNNGEFIKTINKPASPIIDKDFIFKPVKVAVNDSDVMYIVSEGCYNGLLSINNNGDFEGFFAPNKVQLTFSVIANMFWKKIFTQEQINNFTATIPVEYSSVSLGYDEFIYTTTANTENSIFEIKKINPKGDNIINYNKDPKGIYSNIKIGKGDYGDLRIGYDSSSKIDTKFIDLTVDKDGFIFALDASRGRIFQYDQNSILVAVFGGIGEQIGTFNKPVAIESQEQKIYVLDSEKDSLTVFEPNNITVDIRNALLANQKGLYKEAAVYWGKVLEGNINYDVAYIGMGRAKFLEKDYKEAMYYFKLGEDREGYDLAFEEYRKLFMRKYFPAISLITLMALGLALWKLDQIKKRGGGND